MVPHRFPFGRNWQNFLDHLNQDRIKAAEAALVEMLDLENLQGHRFLDIGSGSGLSSLAARRLGADVMSFDYDPQSVACTEELRRRFFPDDPHWRVERGSILDVDYIDALGTFDVVYSWGVLHHTGRMHEALAAAARPVAPGGILFVAIYNDQGAMSRYWTKVKRIYNLGRPGRLAMIGAHLPYLGSYVLWKRLLGAARPRRGMSYWYDFIDWLGGYPFEVARPEEIFEYYRSRGFELKRMSTCGGRMGCNQFVFELPRAVVDRADQHVPLGGSPV